VPGVEEQPPAGSLVVVEHDAPVAHALQVTADLLRLAVLFPRHELQLHGLVYPVVEFYQASSTLDVSLSYRTPYATMRTAGRGAYSGGPGSIGPGLCRILHPDFREFLIPLPRTPVNKARGRPGRLGGG
jgi:hypothetical protein